MLAKVIDIEWARTRRQEYSRIKRSLEQELISWDIAMQHKIKERSEEIRNMKHHRNEIKTALELLEEQYMKP